MGCVWRAAREGKGGDDGRGYDGTGRDGMTGQDA